MKTKLFLFMSSLYFINKAKNQTDFKSKSFKLSNIASLGLMIPFKISPIKCHSEISRPYLGCSIRSTELGVGMVVIMVKSDSPAEIAGIRLKDVILEIEGKPINTIHDYNGAVGSEKGKKKVKIQRKVDNHEKILEMYVEFIK
jgi:S1-C subfamily serine protease